MSPRLSALADLGRARTAGVLYVVLILCGMSSEVLLRGPLIDWTDAARTAQNVFSSEATFRWSIFLDVIMALSDVGLAIVLYVLLRPEAPQLALTAMAFRLVQAAILGLNLNQLVLAQTFAGQGPSHQEQVLVLLQSHSMGYDLGLFFFAINCLVMAAILIRVPLGPAALGWMMASAGLVYFVGSAIHLLLPRLSSAFAPAYALTLVSELWLALWLLWGPSAFRSSGERLGSASRNPSPVHF